ncbi:uncharacterized protein ColSpa_09291 [Colletotrichum spaethianum]|uniref:Uncharacterized protein n=1 Tax=Colletotrichum spaethianum TaxID=700344 RepID=A0AA37UNR6_9PEZI|nr:uncharacterized protein ColSpa_09291 [Colletotrichum spaethianum]GKT49110.1 hypothetical protein ColSpa_09291 [Colletotrichum spaethianum]
MRTALFLAGALVTMAYAAPSGPREATGWPENEDQVGTYVDALEQDIAAASLESGLPPFFGFLLQAYSLRDQDEAALIVEAAQALRDERADLEEFASELQGPAALQRRGAGHGLFEAALESAAGEWTRASGDKGVKKDNKALIGKCVREAKKDKVKAGEKQKGDETKFVMEGLPQSCCELMQEWHDLEGHAAEVEVVGGGVVEFSL